jgi:hypothetical protein
MSHRFLAALFSLVAVLSSLAANAQSRQPPVVRIEAGAIDSAFRSIATTPTEFAREFAVEDKTQYQFVVLSRSTTGPSELHDDWSDIVFVRSGSAILQTGMRLLEKSLQIKESGEGPQSLTQRIRSRVQVMSLSFPRGSLTSGSPKVKSHFPISS